MEQQAAPEDNSAPPSVEMGQQEQPVQMEQQTVAMQQQQQARQNDGEGGEQHLTSTETVLGEDIQQNSPELDRRRVKVYKLSVEEDMWRDVGTGQVSCTFNKILNRMCIRVKSEESDDVILESKISEKQSYTRQGDTIITWEDDEGEGRDLAVSFQEAEGCKDMWEEICNIQSRYLADLSDYEYVPSSQEDDGINTQEVAIRTCDELPQVDFAHLDELVEFFSETMYAQKDVIASMVLRQDFVSKVLNLFKMAEDLDDLCSLRKLFKVMRGLFLLNDSTLLEHLLNSENAEGVFGILEYDPEVEESSKRIMHRQFLKEKAMFKNVATISSPVVLYKIHQNFRIMYLKDVALARYLDEVTFNALNSISFFNNSEIVVGIQSDTETISQFFKLLQKEDSTQEEKRDLVLWLQELCNLSRPLGVQERTAFWRTLCSMGVFEMLENVLWTDDAIARNAIAEIMMCSLVHDGQLLRSYLISESQKANNNRTLRGLVETITKGNDVGMKGQISEMLRMLMDPESLEGCAEKDEFLNVFYENLIETLLEPLVKWDESLPNGSVDNDFDEEEATRYTIMVVIELLAFCVTHHGYRIKYFLIRNQVLSKVLRLVKHKEKAIQLCAIRFIRTCIGMKDDFYYRCIIRDNLLEPIMEVFAKNGNRYNLLNSAVIELFEFIKSANTKKLIEYTVQKFSDIIRDIDYVDTFHMLLVRHEQNKEADLCPTTPTTELGPVRKRARVSDDEQEDYFNREDDDTPSAGNVAGGQPKPEGQAEGATPENAGAAPPAEGQSGGGQPQAAEANDHAGQLQQQPQQQQQQQQPLVQYGEDDDDEEFGPPIPPPKANGEGDESAEVDFRKLSQRQPIVQNTNSVNKRFKFHF